MTGWVGAFIVSMFGVGGSLGVVVFVASMLDVGG